MTTLIVRLIALAAFSSMSQVLGSGSPSPPGVAGGPREVVLGERHHDRTVEVVSGDQLVLRLPMSLPMAWAPVKGRELLREVKQPPKPPTPRGAPAGVPNLGGYSFSDNHYLVAAQPGSQVTVEWVYCYLGRPQQTAQRLAEKRARQGLPANSAPAPFRPDLRPEQLEEGMTYRVTIKVVAPQVTTEPRPVGRQTR